MVTGEVWYSHSRCPPKKQMPNVDGACWSVGMMWGSAVFR